MTVAPNDALMDAADAEGLTFSQVAAAWRLYRWKALGGALLAGVLAYGATFLIAPTFTAATVFLPPQQAQSAAASAIASLGSLANLAGAPAVRSTGDQYVALLQSVNVSDRMVEQFKLQSLYKAEFKVDARRALADRVRISLGKKDGLITVEVDDTSPARAAEMANQYVQELRRMTSSLAVTEAQQRRVFFESQLGKISEQLKVAQLALQSSGFDPGALKAEPRAAAETYAKLSAEAASAEIRLRGLRSTFAEETPEVLRQATVLSALRQRLAQAEQATESGKGSDYVTKYRNYKYQEAIFEVYARQFELARADESREGSLIQVIDPATAPERKSKPRRGPTALGAALAGGLMVVFWGISRVRRTKVAVQRSS